MLISRIFIITFFLLYSFPLPTYAAKVKPGVEQLFNKPYINLIKGKRIGLITNHTGTDSNLKSTIEIIQEYAKLGHCTLSALFGPEHGLSGAAYASEHVDDEKNTNNIPVFSLYGKNRRPTKQMLEKVDVLIFDIQDVGCRSYTYTSTLFYVIEEAKKASIPVIVLDRPNPINGIVIDGPMLEETKRSIVGYINVPYCHGMTVGELAVFFNKEYKINCDLHVVPMKGWKRSMSFVDTGLSWVPTSPQVPFFNTPLYYPITGILGEIQCVNIGVGYTLPFQTIGAPWIDPVLFAKKLNEQNLPGVFFTPIYYRPFFGLFAKTVCKGVLIHVSDHLSYKPVTTGYVIIGMIKSLYPSLFAELIAKAQNRKKMFNKVNGTDKVFNILSKEKYVIWKLREFNQKEKATFLKKRSKYLNPLYSQ